jgi:hypothetical protein
MSKRLEKEFGERIAEQEVGIGHLPVSQLKFGMIPKKSDG